MLGGRGPRDRTDMTTSVNGHRYYWRFFKRGSIYRIKAQIYSSTSTAVDGIYISIGGVISDRFKSKVIGDSEADRYITKDIYFDREDFIKADGGYANSKRRMIPGNIAIFQMGTTNTTKWHIGKFEINEVFTKEVTSDNEWYCTNHTTTGDYIETDVGIDNIAGIISLDIKDARQGYFPGTGIKIGDASQPTVYIHKITEDGQNAVFHLSASNENDPDYGGRLDPSNANYKKGAYIYKTRVNIKPYEGTFAKQNSDEHSLNATTMKSLSFYGKCLPGEGFTRTLNSPDCFKGGLSQSGSSKWLFGFTGPDSTGDTITLTYAQIVGAGVTIVNETNIGTYVNNDTLSSLMDLIIADLNAFETPNGVDDSLVSNKNGPEIIHYLHDRIGSSQSIDGLPISPYIGWQLYEETTGSTPLNPNNSDLLKIPTDIHTGYMKVRNSYSDQNVIVGVRLGAPGTTLVDNGEASPTSSNLYNSFSYPGATIALSNGNNMFETANNPLKSSTTYLITVDLKHDTTSSTAETGFYARIGGVDVNLDSATTGTGEITTSWNTYTATITTGSITPGYSSELIIYSKNSYASSKYHDANFWYIKNISLVEYNTSNYITVTNDTADISYTLTMDVEASNNNANNIVPIGDSETYSVLIGAGAPKDTISYDTGNTITRYYVDILIHSKLFGYWKKDLKWPAEGFDWMGWIDDADYVYHWPDVLMWDESSRLRIVDTNFEAVHPDIDNKTKYFDRYNITNYWRNELNDDLVTWSWASQGPQIVTEAAAIFNNRKEWSYSKLAVDDGVNGLYVDSDDTLGAYNSNAVFANDASMKLNFTRTADDGGIDWAGTAHFYAAAIYDDGGESLPGHKFDSELSFPGTGTDDGELKLTDSLKIYVSVLPVLNGLLAFDDKRIVGIRLYYTHSEEGHETFWDLGAIDFRTGFTRANTVSTIDNTDGNTSAIKWKDSTNGSPGSRLELYDTGSSQYYIKYTTMPKLETFESINGYSPYNSTLNARYKAHCIGGRRSFIGNILVKDVDGTKRIYNDRMIVSPVNALDTYPYPDNILDLDISDGDEIIALASVGDKVLQFKKNMMYVVNISTSIPSEFFVESRNKFKGTASRTHVVETSEGIFWINEFGAYLYDGENIKDLHTSDEEESSNRRIGDSEWNNFISKSSQVGFNPLTRDCFVVRNVNQTTDNNPGDCYIYNIPTDSWTFAHAKFFVGDSTKITNFSNIGANSTLGFMYNLANSASPESSGAPGYLPELKESTLT